MTLSRCLERAYGLAGLRTESLNAAGQRILARVVDDAGRQFVLKARPPWIRKHDFEAVLELQGRAVAAGADIPPPVRTAAGHPICQWRSHDLSLHEWVPGEHIRWTVDHAQALGEAVGAFGRAVAAIDAPQANDWSFPTGRSRWLPDTPRDLVAVGRFLRALPGSATATIHAIRRFAREASDRLDTRGLIQGFIHGDVSPLNSVMSAGRAVLIDLDEMRWGLRLFDAVQGVACLGGLEPGAQGLAVREAWDIGRADAFLRGWSATAAPTAAEIRAFPPFLTLALVRVVVGELDLDDPGLPTRIDAAASTEALLALLRAPAPTMTRHRKP